MLRPDTRQGLGRRRAGDYGGIHLAAGIGYIADMITVPLINWQPITSIPEDRKDGRRLLLWANSKAYIAHWDSVDALWRTTEAENDWGGGSVDLDPKNPADVPTHWADINPPE
jgi:hypothetical protein